MYTILSGASVSNNFRAINSLDGDPVTMLNRKDVLHIKGYKIIIMKKFVNIDDSSFSEDFERA